MDKKATLFEVIEEIGFGLFHVITFVMCAGIWFGEGAEILLINTVTKAVSEEWHLDPVAKALVVTVVFVGILTGNLLSGPLGDNYGRKSVIMVAYVCFIASGIISSFAQTVIALAAARFFVGISFGIGQPCTYALASELTPVWWRFASSTVLQFGFTVGSLYSSLLLMYDDPSLQHLHWRWLLRMGTIPGGVCLIMSVFFLYQSPSFLAINGRYDEAVKVLDAMKWFNRANSVSSEFTPPPPNVDGSLWDNMKEQATNVLGRQMLWSTTVVVFSCFTINLLYFGYIYSFPQVLPGVFLQTSAAFSLFVGGLWEIVGFVIGLIIGNELTRKQAMKVYLVGTILCALSFTCGALFAERGVAAHIAIHAGYYGIRAFPCLGFTVVYQYGAEIYPTPARSTVSAFCLGAGKVGGMLAPILFECFQSAFQSFSPFYVFTAACACLNFLLIDTLPFETAGALLTEKEVQHQGPVQAEDPHVVVRNLVSVG